jgi:hypothetical protein
MSETIQPKPVVWVCDDIRFPNEYEAFLETFYPIKLVVSPKIQQERLSVLYGMSEEEIKLKLSHESEKLVDSIDVPAESLINADLRLIDMLIEVERRLNQKWGNSTI